MRTDRIKGQQWDAMNIKQINSSTERAYLVYSDSVSQNEKELFTRQNQKYLDRKEFSAIDGIINQDTLLNLIETIAISNLSNGQIKDIQGRKFEDRVASILSNSDNLKKYKSDIKTIVGLNYPIFSTIISSINIEPNLIAHIDATSDGNIIGKLPSRGNPKTDVLVTIKKTDGTESKINISCKRSSSKSVSVHEYSAKSFAQVLDPNNTKLSDLLYSFQSTPSLSGFGPENTLEFTKELEPYNQKLAKWVLAGINGPGQPETQWATHILTYDNNNSSISFHTIEEYIDILKAHKIEGHFGTFFSWTYPSKKRGQKIQLKCKIIK